MVWCRGGSERNQGSSRPRALPWKPRGGEEFDQLGARGVSQVEMLPRDGAADAPEAGARVEVAKPHLVAVLGPAAVARRTPSSFVGLCACSAVAGPVPRFAHTHTHR